MNRRGKWTKRMRQLRLDIIASRNKVTANSIFDYADKVSELETKVLKANTQLLNIIDSIQATDTQRGIFTEKVVKGCPRKLPGFAGLESEDFVVFKEHFLEACKDHRIPRCEQPDKLREVLTGRALKHLPRTCREMNVA